MENGNNPPVQGQDGVAQVAWINWEAVPVPPAAPVAAAAVAGPANPQGAQPAGTPGVSSPFGTSINGPKAKLTDYFHHVCTPTRVNNPVHSPKRRVTSMKRPSRKQAGPSRPPTTSFGEVRLADTSPVNTPICLDISTNNFTSTPSKGSLTSMEVNNPDIIQSNGVSLVETPKRKRRASDISPDRPPFHVLKRCETNPVNQTLLDLLELENDELSPPKKQKYPAGGSRTYLEQIRTEMERFESFLDHSTITFRKYETTANTHAASSVLTKYQTNVDAANSVSRKYETAANKNAAGSILTEYQTNSADSISRKYETAANKNAANSVSSVPAASQIDQSWKQGQPASQMDIEYINLVPESTMEEEMKYLDITMQNTISSFISNTKNTHNQPTQAFHSMNETDCVTGKGGENDTHMPFDTTTENNPFYFQSFAEAVLPADVRSTWCTLRNDSVELGKTKTRWEWLEGAVRVGHREPWTYGLDKPPAYVIGEMELENAISSFRDKCADDIMKETAKFLKSKYDVLKKTCARNQITVNSAIEEEHPDVTQSAVVKQQAKDAINHVVERDVHHEMKALNLKSEKRIANKVKRADVLDPCSAIVRIRSLTPHPRAQAPFQEAASQPRGGRGRGRPWGRPNRRGYRPYQPRGGRGRAQ